MRIFRVRRLTVLVMIASLACVAGAYAAVGGLPPGVQVNNDLPTIDPGVISATEQRPMPLGNAEAIEAWDGPLFDRFVQ